MPGLNGIDLLRQIKKEYNGHHYVSIFCVSYGTIHLFKGELIEGLSDYFAEKPFSVDVLKTIMDKAIITLGRLRNKVHLK